jgi:hypothetical protein
MKKLMSFFMTTLLVLSINSTIAFAKENDSRDYAGLKNVKHYTEITDLKVLRERAFNNITDKVNIKTPKFTITDASTLKEKQYDAKETSQLINEYEDSSADNSKVKEYKTTVFYSTINHNNVAGNTTDGLELSALSSGGTHTQDAYDPSYSVEAYSTITWLETTSGGYTYIKITQVTGGWHIYDSHATVLNKYMSTSEMGPNITNGYVYSNTITQYPGLSYNYSYSSSFQYIRKCGLSAAGTTSSCTVKYSSGSTYYLTCENDITM